MKKPLREFVHNMADRFAEENMPFVSDVKKSLFRINRDIRFSANKDPYKTNTGIHFHYTLRQTKGKPTEVVGLYFHIEPGDCFIAGGIHMPPSSALKPLREKLMDEHEIFEKIIGNKLFKKEFPRILEGDTLKTAPRGFPKDHPSIEFLRMKEFTVFSNEKIDLAFSDKLEDTLIRKAKIITPFLEFLREALETE